MNDSSMKRNSNIELLHILGITIHYLVYNSTIMDEPIRLRRLFA